MGGGMGMWEISVPSLQYCLALKIAQPETNSIENNYCSIKPEKLIVYKSANPNEHFSDCVPLGNEANLVYFMMY